MKTLILSFLLVLNSNFLFANGVCVVDAGQGKYLMLLTSQVNVNVDNQVAIIKTTNKFLNETDSVLSFKYAFPLPEEASAIGLRWFIDGKWNEAVISSSPQDTSLPGGGGTVNYNLSQFLGSTPLYFDINTKIKQDSTVIIELTYVQFLKYKFGNVNFTYPNNYTLIQSAPLNLQELNFNLVSSRTIETIQLLSHNPDNIDNSGDSAVINFHINESQADKDYKILYSLSTNELGLFGFSTFQPDSLVPDQYSKGYFMFVIDRSGSMLGSKIGQAKNAADFIVNNLNTGDKFNIVDFSDNISSFRSSHVDFNEENKNAALAYISTLNANGLTNISGAFDTAIPQFINANDSTANIIIFLTDGLPTDGITETNTLLEHIHNLVVQAETGVIIFTFGVGDDVNKQLLTLLASQNKGLSQFLGEDQLEEVITNFYLQIRNPVLLNTQITFSPNVLSEIYPAPLPNLYKGQQMIVSGRYNEGDSVNITLSGEAFGKSVNYDYVLRLSDSMETSYQFLPKVWAKEKIENLLVSYYSLDPASEEAQNLKKEIVDLSLKYGIVTTFTSFTSGGTVGVEEAENKGKNNLPNGFKLLGNYPNPFNPSTTIRFLVGNNVYQTVKIRIYNSLGELIKTLFVNVNGQGVYEVRWNGKTENGNIAASGLYIYVVDFGNVLLSDKMILMK